MPARVPTSTDVDSTGIGRTQYVLDQAYSLCARIQITITFDNREKVQAICKFFQIFLGERLESIEVQILSCFVYCPSNEVYCVDHRYPALARDRVIAHFIFFSVDILGILSVQPSVFLVTHSFFSEA